MQQNVRGRTLAPIPMTYTKLLLLLFQSNLIAVVPLRLVDPSYPKSYDPNMKCDYHGGVIRHSTKKCWGLKHKPNVNSNPLLTHGGPSINVVSHEFQGQELDKVIGKETSKGRGEEVETLLDPVGLVEDSTPWTPSQFDSTQVAAIEQTTISSQDHY
ncbi:hypothetical protein CR513_04606, partial [Mucuna pruriens]